MTLWEVTILTQLLHSFKKEEGFSLVEISIALLIIGILVAGILKGQDLLENARLKSLVSQVNEYRIATNVFQDRYGALPGDYAKASQYIDPSLSNGNDNGKIEGQGLAVGQEAFSFWAHLAKANLISTPDTPSSGSAGSFNQGAPKAKIGGGFTIQYNPFGEGHHWFVLGEKRGSSGQGAGLTPLQAMSLDQRSDNGHPRQGKIRAKDGQDVAPGSCVTSLGTYNVKNTNKACVLYFQF